MNSTASSGGGSSNGKSKRGAHRESNLADKYQTTGKCTTVMIRNIPHEYTQEQFIQEVSETMGSPHLFDFFYLPPNLQDDCNMGYAFINFLDAAAAQHAVRSFSNYQFKIHPSKKVAKVSPAHIQGLENNLRHLQDRAVVLSNHPSSPVVMWKGQKVELSLIFKEFKTQQTLRKFDNISYTSPASSPGNQRIDVNQSFEDVSPVSNSSSPGMAMLGNQYVAGLVGVGEGFAQLLDRAAGFGNELAFSDHARLELQQRAAMSGCGMQVMQDQRSMVPMGGGGFAPGSNSSFNIISPGSAGGMMQGSSQGNNGYDIMAPGSSGGVTQNSSQCAPGFVANHGGVTSGPPPGMMSRVLGPPPGQFSAPRNTEGIGVPLPNLASSMPSTLNKAAPAWPGCLAEAPTVGGCSDAELMLTPENFGPAYHTLQLQDPRLVASQQTMDLNVFGGASQMMARPPPELPMPTSFSVGALPATEAPHSMPAPVQVLLEPTPPSFEQPGLQAAASQALTTPVVKDITLKDADIDLMDKFMSKFGS